MLNGQLLFIIMVFVTVFLLMQGLVVPVFGESAQTRKRLQQRLDGIDKREGADSYQSLLRDKYLKKLSPLARMLENLPLMQNLARKIEQSGHSYLAHRVVLFSVVMGLLAIYTVWITTRLPVVSIVVGFIIAWAPFLKIRRDRNARMAKFEEQLPDAIDVMKRALRAGHPFSSALKLVADDMDDPVAAEFEMTFNDISYGNDVRRALLGLLSRVPSVTVMALVTSIMVQKETGGNLAEVLEQISKVIRGRFRFQRKVKTLTAEGRMSAWVLALVPLVLFATIWITTPDYLPILIEDPRGHNLIIYGAISGVIGIAWIRRIIRIEV
jgi:tight adherence protein B